MVLLSNDELKQMVDNIRVGQVYKCVEDNKLVMISLVRPKEIRGYMFDGFQVVPYVSLVPMDFVRYFDLVIDPRKSNLPRDILKRF
jgi:hypothetical protein